MKRCDTCKKLKEPLYPGLKNAINGRCKDCIMKWKK